MAANEYGLSRDVPNDVAREVRQRSGFGCVVCSSAIYQYEHVDPPFVEARSHDPQGITLLCGGCHDRVTRKLLSKESVKAAMKNPAALKTGFSFGPFDFGGHHPAVLLGSVRAIRTSVIVQVFGEPVLSVAPPEAPHAPFRLSAQLKDREGKEILHIVEKGVAYCDDELGC